MIQKKICMLGAFSVGKTSLVQRFVQNIFSEKYHTTIGVKIDKKTVTVGSETLTMVLWDLAGDDQYNTIQLSYLRGASGYLLVADKTRSNTLDVAFKIRQRVEDSVGDIPHLLLFNKWDLTGKWDIDAKAIDDLQHNGWKIIKTSAKTGMGVEEAFQTLAAKMIS